MHFINNVYFVSYITAREQYLGDRIIMFDCIIVILSIFGNVVAVIELECSLFQGLRLNSQRFSLELHVNNFILLKFTKCSAHAKKGIFALKER